MEEIQTAQQKRNLERIEKESLLKKNGVFIKIYNINGINFGSINSFSNLFSFHFNENNIPFLNKENSFIESLNYIDFRSGENFQNIINNEIKKNENQQFIFYNLYMDSTNLSKNKFKKKNIFNTYLNFNNDNLISTKKKCIYNISCVSEKKLSKIGLRNYISWLSKKLMNEVENIYFFNKNINVKCFLLNILGDNKEIYSILNLKGNFGKGRFNCRVCDHDNFNENETAKNQIMDMETYYHKIEMCIINEDNFTYYNISKPAEASNLFNLKVFLLFNF
jgi:hypothetical protein